HEDGGGDRPIEYSDTWWMTMCMQTTFCKGDNILTLEDFTNACAWTGASYPEDCDIPTISTLAPEGDGDDFLSVAAANVFTVLLGSNIGGDGYQDITLPATISNGKVFPPQPRGGEASEHALVMNLWDAMPSGQRLSNLWDAIPSGGQRLSNLWDAIPSGGARLSNLWDAVPSGGYSLTPDVENSLTIASFPSMWFDNDGVSALFGVAPNTQSTGLDWTSAPARSTHSDNFGDLSISLGGGIPPPGNNTVTELTYPSTDTENTETLYLTGNGCSGTFATAGFDITESGTKVGTVFVSSLGGSVPSLVAAEVTACASILRDRDVDSIVLNLTNAPGGTTGTASMVLEALFAPNVAPLMVGGTSVTKRYKY
ncbi:hypothetical protein KIPB_008713, partial [Kipferlia bialata]